MITPKDLKRKLEAIQAKEWGYNSVKAAQADGYNVTRNNCTVREFALSFKLSESEARNIVDGWKYNNLINYTNCCGLDQIQFTK